MHPSNTHHNIPKHLFLWVAFSLSTLITQAQIWPQPGAAWVYCQEFGDEDFGTFTYTCTNDTLIAGKEYSVIRLTHENQEYIGESGLASYRHMYFRSSNDTIYRRVDDMDYIFFINGLEVGDSFTAFRTNGIYFYQYSCTPQMELMVTAIEEIDVNGESFDLYSLEDINFTDVYEDDLLPPNPIYQFIEDIGPNYNFPYFFPVATNGDPDYCILDVKQVIFWEQLLSYSEGEIFHVFGECIPTSVEENKSGEFKFFPNPVSDHFQIDNPNNLILESIEVYDQRGHLIKSLNPLDRFHSIGNLPVGLYILQIETADGLACKKLVKE